ncbi:MAG TPA: tetratricopeptide repeat protein, partial [Gemmatimonadales bacterium]|nr:tetratricopeptide repeat protein [Gemmatimonadales bacterium]
MNLEKLKDSARKFEQKEDWRKAIEVYLKAIQQIESGAETSPDLSLYNRVGDLYLKINDTASAVRSYERAVDLYADQGFFNNAIALCGKILRVNPGRTQTYLKLAQLHARKNVVIEAKRNLIEFLERMNGLGQLDQAFQSVKEFADQFSGSQEIRMMLVELLRAASREEEALEQLAKIAGELEGLGGTAQAPAPAGEARTIPTAAPARPKPGRGDLVFLDTGLDLPTSPPAPEPATGQPRAVEAPPPEGLELTQAAYETEAGQVSEESAAPLMGLEQTVVDGSTDVDSLGPVAGLELDPSVAGLELEPSPADLTLDGLPLESMDLAQGADAGPVEGLLDSGEDLELSLGATEVDLVASDGADVDLEFEVEPAPGAATAGLPLIEPEPTSVGGSDELAELEDRIINDPDNPDLHRELADRLLLLGELPRAAEELRLSLDGYERGEDWSSAVGIAERLVALEPDAIHNHQKRVELAFRSGDRAPLLDAYLALGDALGRAGAPDKALAVYRRVLEHDPENGRASAAIVDLGEPRPSVTVPASTAAAPAPPASRPAAARPVLPSAQPTAPAATSSTASSAAAGAPPAPPTPSAPPPSPARGGTSEPFVDLGSMILDESSPRDTRMRIDRREPEDKDEQREFQEILEQFKRGIEQNLDTDDYQAHYDLGVAFKEMGL